MSFLISWNGIAEGPMNGLKVCDDLLDLIGESGICSAYVLDLFRKGRFLRHVTGIFLVVDVTRNRIRDVFFNERIFALPEFRKVTPESGLGFRFDDLSFLKVEPGRVDYQFLCLVVEGEVEQRASETFAEIFLADIRLGAAMYALGFCAVIVGVALLDFGGHFEPAFSADEYAAKGEGALGFSTGPSFLVQPSGSRFKDRRGHQCLVNARIASPLPMEHTRINRVRQDSVDGAFSDLVARARTETLLVEVVGEFVGGDVRRRVQLKGAPDERGKFRIGDHLLRFRFGHVSDGSRAGIFSESDFFIEPALHVAGEIADVLVRHGKFDARDDDIVARKIVAVKGSDMFDFLVLQFPLEKSFVDGITCESVDLPTQDAFGLSALDISDHVGKDRAPGRLGRFRLLKDFHDRKVLATRDFLHLDDLRLDRQTLPIFAFC